MANVKITDLPLITGITINDVIPIVDVDTVVTSKVTIGDLKDYFDTPFTGGTVSGDTEFTNGLTANTISATTYFNLPTDVFVTGGTYSNNTFTYTNNTGGTFDVSFDSVSGLTSNGTIESNAISATTISGDTFIGIDADEVSYDNSISGLIASNVQDAIDEVTDKFINFNYWKGNYQHFLENQGSIPATAGVSVFDVNVLFAFPINIKEDVTITEFQIAYSTSVSGNSVYGLYDMLDGLPNNLIFQSTAFNNAVTGVQTYTLPAPEIITKGIYFVAYNTSSVPNVYAFTAEKVLNVYGANFLNINANPNIRLTAGYTYTGTLPSPFGTNVTRTNGGHVPAVLFKI